MEITGENGVVYSFEIVGDKLTIKIRWKGVTIKRFSLKSTSSEAWRLHDWIGGIR